MISPRFGFKYLVTIFHLLVNSYFRAENNRASLIAGGCAFYATLALFPAINALLSIYGWVSDPKTVVEQVVILKGIIPPQAYTLILEYVKNLTSQESGHLAWRAVLSFLLAIWSASTATKSILSAVDHFIVGGRSTFWRFQLIGISLTLGAIVIIIILLSFLIALPYLLTLLGLSTFDEILIHTASLFLVVLFVSASIATFYHFGPPPKEGQKNWIWPGAIMATIAWIFASHIFTVYLTRIARYDITYGPLATFAGIMIWLWLTNYIVVLGASLNAEMVVWSATLPAGDILPS